MERQQLEQLFAYSLTTSPLVQQGVTGYVDYTDSEVHIQPSITVIWSSLVLFTLLGAPLATFMLRPTLHS